MTAPTNPAPLPVVACWMWTYPDGTGHSVCDVNPNDGGPVIPALAVPLALFEDGPFALRAVWRLEDSYGYVSPDMMLTCLDAIADELRERAGVDA